MPPARFGAGDRRQGLPAGDLFRVIRPEKWRSCEKTEKDVSPWRYLAPETAVTMKALPHKRYIEIAADRYMDV